MIKFDLSRFLLEKRFSHSDLGKILKHPQRSISYMVERQTVKPSFLKKLESLFGDLSEYIIDEKINEAV
jgi:hypothetical protein